jgi:thioester reductase-like protein
LSVAAFNGPANTVIAGPKTDLESLAQRAQQAGVTAQPLAVSHPFHSTALQPMLAAFEQALQPIRFCPPQLPLVSNVSGALAGAEIASADYWCEQVISPVRFADGVRALLEQGASTFLEIGVRPTLIGMARQLVAAEPAMPANTLHWLPSLVPGRPDLEVMLGSLAVLQCAGAELDWQGFHAPFSTRRIQLPGYPFQRQRYWWSAPEQSSGPASLWLDHIGLNAGATPDPGLRKLDLPGAEHRYELWLTEAHCPDLADHCIRRQRVFPAAGFLEQTLALLQAEGVALHLQHFSLAQPLRLQDGGAEQRLQLLWNAAADQIRLFSSRPDGGWMEHGQLATAEAPAAPPPWLPAAPPEGAEPVDLEAFYGALAACGLRYGPAFRQLRQLRRQQGCSWAELERQAGGRDRGLLDSCFQAVAAALDPAFEGGNLYLPVGLEALQFQSAALPDRFACEVRLRPSPEPALVLADLLLHQQGQVLGWITGFRLRRIPRQALDWMVPQEAADADGAGPASLLISSQWRPLEPALDPQAPVDQPQRPLLLQGAAADKGLHGWLAAKAAPLQTLPLRRGAGDWRNAVTAADALWIWPDLDDPKANATDACALLLEMAQALAASPATRQVWLVLQPGPGVEAQTLAGALRGWWRTAALEQPDLNWTLLELPPAAEPQPEPQHWAQLWQAARREASLAWRDGQILGLRLEPLALERYRWATATPGSLEGLQRRALAEEPLAPGEVEIAVEATGLNFRDVLNALGLLAAHSAELGLQEGSQLPFGGECVGRVVAVGPGVSEQRLGERVLAALAVGSLASHVRCRAQLCVPLPAAFSPELGASLSTAFLTAIYGLQTLAQLQPGDTVLIHAAAGGVGQAALQVARRCGARIFATASQAKQAALLEQGVEAVFDSRNTAFAEQLLQATGGRGVDVVLNSLKGEWVDAGFRALAPGGRFVELGKIEIWSRREAAERRPDARYLPFDLLEVAAAEPALIRQLLEQLLADLQTGSYSPIPMQTFDEAQTVEAFRWMAQARHVGKLVIRRGEQAAPLRLRSDATYLVSGGVGALGRQLLGWLVDQGVRSLLVVSRSADQPPAAFQAQLSQWSAQGVRCQLLPLTLGAAQAEAALAATLAALPAEQPLRGLFHAAGVLDDGLISGQTAERLKAVLAPKLEGWLQLQRAVAQTQAPLDFAVAFSSMAALLGSPGQSNYGAANGALDGACEAWAGFGGSDAVTLAVQWGPWAGEGMAAGQGRRLQALGVGLLPPDAALEALGLALRRGRSGSLAVLNNTWPQLLRQAPPRQAAAMAALAGSDAPTGAAASGGERQRLLELPERERGLALVELLQRRLAAVMGLEDPQAIDPGDSLFQIGLDSLMAVELAAGVQQDLGVKLELESLAGDPSLEALAVVLLRQFSAGPGAAMEAELDLGQEAQLPSGWSVPPGPAAQTPGEAILLTGGSGFLGAYLLAGQLQRWPELQVQVLVRAADAAAGAERLRRNLELYGLWQEAWAPRILPIPGDLAQPRFGLEPGAFSDLAQGISGILHNGAQLSQMAPYSQLAAANVGGTRTVLELAALERPLPVELISSVAVYEARAYRNRQLLENDDLAEWRGIQIGYSQTKWVSERLVLAAGRAGLPVRVYRPPLIAGHSQSGLWHQDDLLHRLLRGCLELGLAPAIDWELDLVPVDYVANAVTAMAWRPPQELACLHLHHPQPLLLADVLGGLIERGAPLQLVPMAHWLEALEQQPANPLYPIRAFFSRRWGEEQLTYPELNQAGVRARPATAATVAALEAHGVVCPSFEQLIGPYARTFLGSLALG